MTALRLEHGGLIDRGTTLPFRFDGRDYTGHPGDSLASALLAAGVRIMGRSFKYHRPRGPWGAWVDDPNVIFDIALNGTSVPNMPGASTALEAGMDLRAVNAWPSAARDLKAGLDLFHRWLPAGFYYKTFIRPDWHLFEPVIRRAAGLGRVEPDLIEAQMADQRHAACDLLVIGGGPAGLAAARAAAEAGQDVWLVEDHDVAGGSLYRCGAQIEGLAPSDWVAAQLAAIAAAGGTILTRTTAFGIYDHGLVALITRRGFAAAPALTRLRPARTLLASGAIDRPVTFAGNDLPGIMSLEAGLEYLGRYGVLAGRRIVIAASHQGAEPAADRLRAAGAEARICDPAEAPIRARGRGGVQRLEQSGRRFETDLVLSSAGPSPLLHLWRQAGGKLDWDPALTAFLPGEGPAEMQVIGAAAGCFDPATCLEEARAAALGPMSKAPVRPVFQMRPVPVRPKEPGRQWIDFQNDVTLKDVALAARENYVSVEHLKRYTTLGMAPDQGKTSNVAGLTAMAALRGLSVPEVGTTTFRPPFVPVPLEMYRGQNRGQQFHALRRLALEHEHRQARAALGEYGGWLRPGWYGTRPGPEAALDEAARVRRAGGIFDGSPLGKIEVMGPDAAAFLNFIYYNTMSTLAPGRIRYGFMLGERGTIIDDGVLMRVAPEHFIVSCSSGHTDHVNAMLEIWRQDGNDPDRIFVHDATDSWVTLSVTGREARHVLEALSLSEDLSAGAFPHMHLRETSWRGEPLRLARVSFTGELGYELSVPAALGSALWTTLVAAGAPLGVLPFGTEALSILRAEKGYILAGKDTDGETMPQDLGFEAPRLRKSAAHVGDRSLWTETALDPDRRQLVGLAVPEGQPPLPTGAHIVTGSPQRSEGIVTSSYRSPALGRPIALALLQRGGTRMGAKVQLYHLGEMLEAEVVSPVAFDPEGVRLDA